MSDILSAEEFIENTGTADTNDNFRMAVVVALFPNNTAKITFDGESAASEKQYSYIASYVPQIGDRVLLAAVSGTYIILGKVNYNVSPESGEDNNTFIDITVTNNAKVKTLNATGAVDFDSTLNVDGKVTFRNDLEHKGTRIGFFNTSPITKQTAYMPNSQADLAAVRTRLQELITKLSNYGLFTASY
ncbi:hypothetical protein [Clostridium thermarum]|uniref:hypothetical protein n=1 Tax=Clostridium thermarum TaxID=1716543 RepID=UPI001121A810|nr:hypothetical protein [Clostridium thermarum]